MNKDRSIRVNWEKVEEFKEFRGWNFSDLAQAMGYKPSYISKVRSGESHVSMNFIERLGSLLNLPIESVCFFVDKDGNRVDKMGVKISG